MRRLALIALGMLLFSAITSAPASGQTSEPPEAVSTTTLIQESLWLLGYNPGRLDGVACNQTTDALHRFQTDNGLSPGPLDDATMDELILRLQSGTTAPEWDLLAVPQPAPTSEPADALTSLMDDELIGEYPAYFSETTTAPFAPLSMTSEHVDEDAWILGFRNRDGSSDYYDMATGTWTFGFRNRDGSNDLFSLGSGARAMGFRNRDGSSDYYHLGTGGWTYGFRNRDGSFDYLDSRSGTWSYGFRNRDGSQDFYLPKYGWPHYRK